MGYTPCVGRSSVYLCSSSGVTSQYLSTSKEEVHPFPLSVTLFNDLGDRDRSMVWDWWDLGAGPTLILLA